MRWRQQGAERWPGWAVWALAIGLFMALWLYCADLFPWAADYPKSLRIPAARCLALGLTNRVAPAAELQAAARAWAAQLALNEATFGIFTFSEFTRFIAALLDVPYRFVLSLISTGFLRGEGSQAVQILPPLSWVAVIGCGAILGQRAGGRRLAALVVGCLAFVLVFGQWQSAMVTLASILVAVPLGVAGGLLMGILAFRNPWFERAIRPVLDLMQTIPVFAYLVPILILFGFGPTAAVVATLIYAMPPMTRITELALRRVPSELIDLGHMVGCTRRQMMWRVMVRGVVTTARR